MSVFRRVKSGMNRTQTTAHIDPYCPDGDDVGPCMETEEDGRGMEGNAYTYRIEATPII